ncbi:hypothetical protein NQ318_000316 [Aromia moschata]|uniref:Uncharacterized protein n=1 Tax=Aromia moschata TaxID=1265417 RepID=A0AAV8XSK9_9CUCU|nr:hypothetical protein NQ318_000316 [Aromia moschata]
MGDSENTSESNHLTPEPLAKATRFRNLPSISDPSDEDLHAIITNTNNEDSGILSSVRRRVQINKEKVQIGSLNVYLTSYNSLGTFVTDG